MKGSYTVQKPVRRLGGAMFSPWVESEMHSAWWPVPQPMGIWRSTDGLDLYVSCKAVELLPPNVEDLHVVA